jgi:acyl dehydratase
MPLHTSMLGGSTRRYTHTVDARWLMAYAAGLGDINPRYLDTAAGTVIAHPVFPVCIEWPVILGSREMKGSEHITRAESARGVHAAHDLHLYRPIRAGDELTTQATMVGIEAIRPGARYLTRLDTTENKTGELVARTWQTGIYRGVAVEGPGGFIEQAPELPATPALTAPHVVSIPVAAGLANVYTETARIFNPIHSDRAVALSAALPDIILHGTATLALAVGALVNRVLDGDATRVNRLGGHFRAMVLMPSTLRLHFETVPGLIRYRVLTEQGDAAIDDGFVCHR